MTASRVTPSDQTEYDPILLAHTAYQFPLAPPGHRYYLPDEHYFPIKPFFQEGLEYRITARTLARWADRYMTHAYGPSRIEQGGEFPLGGSTADRERTINELFDWFDGYRIWADTLGLILYVGDRVLANWWDGFRNMSLLLTGAQFQALRQAWRANGLPDDLFYPASARRSRLETRLDYDGVPFRRLFYYSPRSWPLRPRSTGATIKIPSDTDLAQLLLGAYVSYQRVLLRLTVRLRDANNASDRGLLDAVELEVGHDDLLMLRLWRWADPMAHVRGELGATNATRFEMIDPPSASRSSAEAATKIPSDADFSKMLIRAFRTYLSARVRIMNRLDESEKASDKEMLDAIHHSPWLAGSLAARVGNWAHPRIRVDGELRATDMSSTSD